MSAVRQTYAENRVAGLQCGKEHRLVRLRAGVRLHVHRIGMKELLRAVDRKPLGDVDEFASAVVTLSRISFGVLVGKLRALCLQHRCADVIFRRDKLDVFFLAPVFRGDRFPKLRIGLRKCRGAREHGAAIWSRVEGNAQFSIRATVLWTPKARAACVADSVVNPHIIRCRLKSNARH